MRHAAYRAAGRNLLVGKPKGMENLIVAGRCVSTEREVLGPVRIMGPCFMMGQAAGTASALAKETGYAYRQVDTGRLRQMLWDAGVLNPDELPFD